ncbi:MAG: thiamine phosphate synthase [bacterium]
MDRQKAIYRIIDVNLDRASEGLRVIEDAVRFGLDDYPLTRKVRQLRHFLIKVAEEIPHFKWSERLSYRDVEKDVGTALTEKEKREGFENLVKANFGRVQEAERSLEEFVKLISSELGPRFKRLRFQTYSLEKKVAMRLEKRYDFSLYVITDSSLIKEEEFEEKLKEVVSNGASAIQLREKTLSLSAFFEKALFVREIIPEDVLFVVNDRVDIALASGADGVHLGQEDLPILAARKVLGPHKIIGASTHSVEQAQQAEREGVDYVAIGPVFSTTTKPGVGAAKGIGIIGKVKEKVDIPVIAIGGVNSDNVEKALKAGADGVAVISAVFKEADTGVATRRLSEKIRAMKKEK